MPFALAAFRLLAVARNMAAVARLVAVVATSNVGFANAKHDCG